MKGVYDFKIIRLYNMRNAIGVAFKKTGKIYYFDSKGHIIKGGMQVIVETTRGKEIGTVVKSNFEVDVKDFNTPLKPVIRIATADDIKRDKVNRIRKEESFKICKQKIIEHGLDMNLIDVDFTFDQNKVIFYFTSDGRVDFRELVKDLASNLKTRIELRQVGVRDEAKIKGGIGICGRELCCHQWLTDFHPVSIKMAKNQSISLNPTKISGICGRLMCCLQYENDMYSDFKKGMPQPGDRVKTKEGIIEVTNINLIEGIVSGKLIHKNDKNQVEDGELMTVHKNDFTIISKNNRSKKIESLDTED